MCGVGRLQEQVGTLVEEQPHQLPVVPPHRLRQRAHAKAHLVRIYRRAPLEQQLHDLMMPTVRRFVVHRVDLRPALEQQLHRIDLPSRRRPMERRVALVAERALTFADSKSL